MLLQSLALALLMLFAQQGALIHEIEHLVSDSVPAEPHGEPKGDKICSLCLSFAAMHAPATAALPQFGLLELAFGAPSDDRLRAVRCPHVAPRSRGPPTVS